jgi:hypothetical protein
MKRKIFEIFMFDFIADGIVVVDVLIMRSVMAWTYAGNRLFILTSPWMGGLYPETDGAPML